MSDNLSCQIYRCSSGPPRGDLEAITTPSFTTRYFHGAAIEVRGNRVTSHGPTGAPGVMPRSSRRTARTGSPTVGSPSRPRDGEGSPSRVTWEIEERDGGVCMLSVTHDQLEGAPKTAQSVSGAGWMFVLSGLKTLLETGQPLLPV